MTDRSEEHIAGNDDLIERYVLGRLSPAERAAADRHLQSCTACRAAVQSEGEFAAGIKEAGRQDLRSRLKKRIAESGRREIPWRAIISAAAVVAVVAMVGITNNWFHIRNEQQVTSSDTQYETSQSNAPAAALDSPIQTQPAAKPDKEAKVGGKQELSLRKHEDVAKTKDLEQKSLALRDSPAPTMVSEINRMDKISTVAAVEGQEVWVEGFVIDRETQENKVPPGEPNGKKSRALDAAEGKAGRLMLSGGAIPPSITVSQEPFHALSIAQQKMQQQQRLHSIATRMEQTTHGIHLTLYPESPIDSSALAQARVELMTDDSLVVALPGQRIAYPLPSSWRTTRK